MPNVHCTVPHGLWQALQRHHATTGETTRTYCAHGTGRLSARLIVDSRGVLGQDWRNRLFVRAFPRGHGQCGILGKSCFISRASVLYGECKTPESNMSQPPLVPTVFEHRCHPSRSLSTVRPRSSHHRHIMRSSGPIKHVGCAPVRVRRQFSAARCKAIWCPPPTEAEL
jgi:hypothetical protein